MAGASGFAVGLGLTNDCNLACAHCYRDTGRVHHLSLADVRRICESLPIRAVNLGTGENALHPEFRAILHELHARGLVVSLTSNGYSTSVLDDEDLGSFRDVEFSLDFATESEQDSWRGPGNWRLVLRETVRARRLGVAVTIVAVMMRTNYDRLVAIARVAAAHGAAFRVNVYQPVKTDAFSLTYDQFWAGFRLLFEACPVAVCSEPLVRAVLDLGPRAEGCGCKTVRVTPRGEVLPCVYWPKRSLGLDDLERLGADVVRSPAFAELDTLPDACRGCPLVDVCHGGCASRRLLRGGLELPDEFCPFVNGRPLPHLPVHRGGARDFPKAASACTSVFTGAR